jgi:hypothetical protein
MAMDPDLADVSPSSDATEAAPVDLDVQDFIVGSGPLHLDRGPVAIGCGPVVVDAALSPPHTRLPWIIAVR